MSNFIGKIGLLFVCILIGMAGRAQEKLPTGLYRSISLSSFKYIDPVSLDTFYADPAAVCTAADFSEVKAVLDQAQQPAVEITLTEAGKEKFAQATRENIGKKIAVIGNGKLLAAPVVQEEIAGGRLTIAGNFTLEETRALTQRISKDMPARSHGAHEAKGKAALEKACRQLDDAMLNIDTVALKQLLHIQLSVGHSNGLVESKAELLQHLRSGYLKYSSIVATGSPEMQFVDRVATVRRAIKVKGSLQGTAFDVTLQVLEVWLEVDGSWQLLCRQSIRKQ
ncbi:nuclear transport factor 2 family protein [Taibaiella koreensis]|uniref:nuclear transport factor 2 family protein n=1 Tax=Taibaiella koreensis TaxID=1268548 RepID=UPI000E59F9FC|nr:nuclear transport factor 2 family protein [Taibaiella koreensis]